LIVLTGVLGEHKIIFIHVEPVPPERGYLEISVEDRWLAFSLVILIHGVVAVYQRTVGGLENMGLCEEVKLLFEFVLERVHQKSDVLSNDSDGIHNDKS